MILKKVVKFTHIGLSSPIEPKIKYSEYRDCKHKPTITETRYVFSEIKIHILNASRYYTGIYHPLYH